MPIVITARYKVLPQHLEECKLAVLNLVEYVRKNEPGTELYLAQQDILDPLSFLHTIIFKNEAALTIHQSSPASARFVKVLYPKTVAPLDFNEFNLLATKIPTTE